jgi:hypothetical protein
MFSKISQVTPCKPTGEDYQFIRVDSEKGGLVWMAEKRSITKIEAIGFAHWNRGGAFVN